MATTHSVTSVRNSRWGRDPCVRGGRQACLQLTGRDYEILRLLARYPALPGDYIHAFVGGSKKVVMDRLGRMTRKPYCLLRRPNWQRSKLNPNCRHAIYELDEPGARLTGTEVQRINGNMDHQLMAGCIMASIELGVRTGADVRLIGWDDIVTSKSFPSSSLELQSPHSLPISLTLDGARIVRSVFADTKPFGIERAIDGRKSHFFFAGMEADCNTEPVFSGNYKRSSIYLKFAAYLAIIEKNIHRERWGVPNLYIPFVTTTETHKQSMMKLLDRMTEGKGSKHILFNVMHGFTFLERPEPPSGRMLTEDWDRVGYPSFNILKS